MVVSHLASAQVTPTTLVHPSWILDDDSSLQDLFVDSTKCTFQDNNVELSDYESDRTDSSASMSPDTSPTTKTLKIEDPFKLLLSPEVATPSPPLRYQRTRMSREEQKVRHREVQRRFMKRKRARVLELRKIKSYVEKQLRLLMVFGDIEELKKEKQRLQQQWEACENETFSPPMNFGDLVFSVPSEELEMPVLEWHDVMDLLPDHNDVEFDVDSEMTIEMDVSLP